LLRNAAIALGNRPTTGAIPALARGLGDTEPLVRGACAWALGQYAEAEARQLLIERRIMEENPEVVREIDHSLSHAVDCSAKNNGESIE
jgi:epoxyqueuosine reductase